MAAAMSFGNTIFRAAISSFAAAAGPCREPLTVEREEAFAGDFFGVVAGFLGFDGTGLSGYECSEGTVLHAYSSLGHACDEGTTIVRRARTPRRDRGDEGYSTVTDFARFRGLSTSVPRHTAA